MALKPISIFSESTYLSTVDSFVTWVTTYVQDQLSKTGRGWESLVRAYEWGGDRVTEPWRLGIQQRMEFNEKLNVALANDDISGVVDEMRRWGGSNIAFDPSDLEAIRDSLTILDKFESNESDWENLFARRIANASKIYEMYDPEKWVIYDSRVALALQILGSVDIR
jgi:hypothetical protein